MAEQQYVASNILEQNPKLEQRIVDLYMTPMTYEEVSSLLTKEGVEGLSAEVIGFVIRRSNLITDEQREACKKSNSHAQRNRAMVIARLEEAGFIAWTEMRTALLEAAVMHPPQVFDADGNELLGLVHQSGAYKGRPNYRNISTTIADTAGFLPEHFGETFAPTDKKCRSQKGKLLQRREKNTFSIMAAPTGNVPTVTIDTVSMIVRNAMAHTTVISAIQPTSDQNPVTFTVPQTLNHDDIFVQYVSGRAPVVLQA